jgi:hypothetical protein
MLVPVDDVDAWVRARTAWHTLAERVLAPARHAADGRIGLRSAPGGFTTPEFGDGRSLAVDGTELVRRDGAAVTRRTVTTLGEAAAFAGVAPDADTGVYAATTPADPATSVAVDPVVATALATWFAFGDRVLGTWAVDHADETPAEIQLWPEHFDLATDLGAEPGRANYGASPGDAAHPLPYLYVGPWRANDDPFWNAGTYARLGHEDLRGRADPDAAALAFFRAGHAAARRTNS